MQKILNNPEKLACLEQKLELILGEEDKKTLLEQKWPENAQRAIKLIENLLNCERKEIEGEEKRDKILENTAILLKYPAKKSETEKPIKCPTCGKSTLDIRALNIHRGKSEQCKEQWRREKNALKCCKNDDCSEVFKTEKQLANHEKYHCKNENKNFRKLRNGIFNRCYQTNTGDPTGEDEYTHKGRIKFDSNTQKWICLECGYSAGTYNSKAVKMHWNKHARDLNKFKENEKKNKTHKHDSEDIENRFMLLNLDDKEISELQQWHDHRTNANGSKPETNENNDYEPNNDENDADPEVNDENYIEVQDTQDQNDNAEIPVHSDPQELEQDQQEKNKHHFEK